MTHYRQYNTERRFHSTVEIAVLACPLERGESLRMEKDVNPG